MPQIVCDPSALSQLAACMKCIPPGMQREVIIYLLCSIGNIDPDPKALMDGARCMKCIPTGMQDEIISYLLCQLTGTLNTP